MKTKIPLLCALGTGAALPFLASAETYTFEGVGGANWNAAPTLIWSPGAVPGAGDTVNSGVGSLANYLNLQSTVTTIANLNVDPAWAIYAPTEEKTFNITETYTKSGAGNMIFRNGSGQMNLNIGNVISHSSTGAASNTFFGFTTDVQAIKSLNITEGLTLTGGGAGVGNNIFLNVNGPTNLGVLTYNGTVSGFNQFVYLVATTGVGSEREITVNGIDGNVGAQIRGSAFAASSGTHDVNLVINTASGQSYNSYVNIANGLSATLSLEKQGAGTQTLTYHTSTYTGGTLVKEGLLDVLVTTGAGSTPLGSGDVVLDGGNLSVRMNGGQNSLANKIITRSADSKYSLLRSTGVSYAGYSLVSEIDGGINTTAQLLDGVAGADRTVTSSFRASTGSGLLSDILTLDGTSNDVYVLQFVLADVTPGAFIVFWNDHTWVNAATLAGGSTQFIEGAYNPGEHFAIGTYGIDLATGQVWAVLDFDGEFAVAVIPEPGSALLVSLVGLACGIGAYMRRRRSTGAKG